MKHLDLFSGIGGFALAAQWVWGHEHEIHSFVEIEPFCQKVLKKHWPEVPIHDDIKTYKHDGTAIDLLTGGFPCQPFSVAGNRRGKEDDRFLWPEMLRIISESLPNWIIGENVAGSITMVLDEAFSNLEDLKYKVQPFVLPACSINAPHKRDRVWIVANRTGDGWCCGENTPKGFLARELTENSFKQRCGRPSETGRMLDIDWPEAARKFCRVDDGLPGGLDKDRMKALGNAIVPQVVAPIMEAIKTINNGYNNCLESDAKKRGAAQA